MLSEQVAKISHDQESVTIWDDAVRKTKLEFDPEWTDINFGTWMFDYFGHDRAFILNDRNEADLRHGRRGGAELSTYDPERETDRILSPSSCALCFARQRPGTPRRIRASIGPLISW